MFSNLYLIFVFVNAVIYEASYEIENNEKWYTQAARMIICNQTNNKGWNKKMINMISYAFYSMKMLAMNCLKIKNKEKVC